jgi:hypothetical protein
MKTRKKRRPVVLKRDHARPRQTPRPSDAVVEARLTELVAPATYALLDHDHRLGLRERILTLPVTVALVLTMVWRQVPSISELVRLLAREDVLWVAPRTVSPQAVDQRLRTLPGTLFAELWARLLPHLHARAAARTRPFPPVVTRTLRHFPRIWIVDASTLEELFTTVGVLRGRTDTVLAGTILALLDLVTKLPLQSWFDPNPDANEKRFLDQLKPSLEAGTLLLFDRGCYTFPFFDWLTESGICFLTRARESSSATVLQTLHDTPHLHDQIIAFGTYRSNPCRHPVRRIDVKITGKWHRYLTNVLDPTLLSPLDVGELSGQRWRIEDAFLQVKRLLGLAYLWSGSFNGIVVQLWATWLLYGVVVDLGDAVAEDRQVPLSQISLEMVFRGLYHFSVAYSQGKARDPVAYFVAPENADLGIVKRPRNQRETARQATLDILRLELNW